MKIGILGYGTVASGLVDIIDNNKDKRDISIEGILVRDVSKHAHRKHSDVLTSDIEDIFNKDDIFHIVHDKRFVKESYKRGLINIVDEKKDLYCLNNFYQVYSN